MNPNSAPPAAAAPAAAAPGETAAAATAYAPPNVTAQQMPGQQPPGTIYIQTYGPQAPVYNTHQAVSSQNVPFVSIVSPEDNRKIRKMQCLNLGFSLLQLACSITIILVVRYHLAFFRTTSTPYGGVYVEYLCLAATPAWTGMCEYAYALACTSILFCFILSLMQCLTMDCCGMGRGMEAIFDFIMAAWWTAGTVTLGVRADEANKMGIPNRDARNSVVALSAISALLFWVLMITNIVLIKRLGKAYKNAHQQTQQHMTAHLPGIPTATYQHPSMPASTVAGPAGTIAQETGAYPAFSKDAVSKV